VKIYSYHYSLLTVPGREFYPEGVIGKYDGDGIRQDPYGNRGIKKTSTERIGMDLLHVMDLMNEPEFGEL
jgi:hypothetical protein